MHDRRWFLRSAIVRVVVMLALASIIPALTSLSTTTLSPFQGAASACRARIGIVTTSDWTTVRLLSGGSLEDVTVISASTHALQTGSDDGILTLSQSLARAEAGQSVDLVVEALITGLERGGTLVFEIERGHIGSTEVEIASHQDESVAFLRHGLDSVLEHALPPRQSNRLQHPALGKHMQRFEPGRRRP